jgi:hypothetical protein
LNEESKLHDVPRKPDMGDAVESVTKGEPVTGGILTFEAFLSRGFVEKLRYKSVAAFLPT